MKLHMSGYISFIFDLIKRLRQKPSRGVCSERLTKLAATAGPHTPNQKIILTGILEISGRNPGVGLDLTICIFRLKGID